MPAAGAKPLISVDPEELKFVYELEKTSYCDLKVINNTENHAAFKVKTTSPKKYFVRPNTGVIQPWDSCIIRVTLQAPREYPLDMQCKDKFLLQSTVVAEHIDVDDLPQNTFNKDSGKPIEERKLKVSYISAATAQANLELDALKTAGRSPETIATMQRLKEEKDAAALQTRQLQQELDMIRRRKNRTRVPGFSFKFAAFVGLIGMMVGFLLNLSLSSPPTLVNNV